MGCDVTKLACFAYLVGRASQKAGRVTKTRTRTKAKARRQSPVDLCVWSCCFRNFGWWRLGRHGVVSTQDTPKNTF